MEDYQDFGPSIVAVSLSLVIVAAILVIIRTFYRIKSHAFGADDALIIAAVTFSISHSVVDVICTLFIPLLEHDIVLIAKYSCLSMGLWQAQRKPDPSSSYSSRTITGKGRMVFFLLAKLTVLPQGFWIAQLLYKLVVPFTKLSICLLYRRLFERAGRTFKIALYSVAGLIVLYYAAAWLTTVFECTPVRKSWQKSIPGTCINTATFFFVNAGFNIATDVAIMVLPIPVIYSLHLPTRQKVALCFVFAIGIM